MLTTWTSGHSCIGPTTAWALPAQVGARASRAHARARVACGSLVRDEGGQTSSEVLGVLLVVTLIISALSASLPGAIASAMVETVCQITQSDCGDESSAPRAAPGPTAPPEDEIDEERLREAVEEIHSKLDPGGWGVTAGDLDRIREILLELPPAEREAAILAISERDLEIWGDQMNENTRTKGGWSTSEKDAFFSAILPDLSPEAIERLASTNGYLSPEFDGGNDYGAPDYAEQGPFAPSADDIDQGGTGDCYFLAALGAVAEVDPGIVRRMVRRNPNGTYTVSFHPRGAWDVESDDTFEVTVIPEFANGLNEPPSNADEFYMQIIEKAWAQHGGGYDKVASSRPAIALEMITGHESSGSHIGLLSSFDPIEDALAEGRAVTASTDLTGNTPTVRLPDGSSAEVEISGQHVFMVTGVRDGMIVVRNPWGGVNAEFLLTLHQFRANFSRYNEVPTS